MRRIILCMLACVAGMLTQSARADNINVWQESAPGVGDFFSNPVGVITTYNSGLTLQAHYDYDGANNVSYGNNGPTLTANQSHLFLVNGSNGLGLFIVHDKPGVANGGGSAAMSFALAGDTASILVRDDPSGDSYVTGGGGTTFTSAHNWVSPNTDGLVIGTLEGDWAMLINFREWSGLTNWKALSNDGNNLDLVFESGRRVLLSPVPAPAGVILAGLGLVGVGLGARFRRRAKAIV